ncbi:MAG TPA: efflux RND transporter periplasmic adaptor subunit [Gemmataceae bacterium]|nr:efflux RND transporter periplasmic adaptor subunit [Gemmataceae bacterium]
MPTAFRPYVWVRSTRCRRLGFWLLAVLATAGCGKKHQKTAPDITKPPKLHLIQPQLRKISRVVGQPSFVQSYERTSIYSKVTAFIKKWNVDIGDKVQKGDVLADLFVPELKELSGTKNATVQLEKERVAYAGKMVKVAEAEVKAADAHVAATKRLLAAYKAEVDRWDSEVDRLKREVKRHVVAPQILLESQNQHKSDTAKWQAQQATVLDAEANLLAKQAELEAAVVDVKVAEARVAVAESESRRLRAWVGYLKLYAPYDGIIVARNANTWDFVLPTMGDPTAEIRAPHLSPGGQAAPIYVVDRTDIVRIYVDIPERDADYIHVGSEAKVKIWAYRDAWLSASVTRLSWALNTKSRTMRAEIDLPNYDSKILPGMYAYGKVTIERPDIRAIPKSAISHAGGKTFVWLYEDGKAKRTEIQTGVRSGKWIEVISRGTGSKYYGHEDWAPITGSEQVLIGPKLSTLTEDTNVEIDDTPAPVEEESLQERNNAM